MRHPFLAWSMCCLSIGLACLYPITGGMARPAAADEPAPLTLELENKPWTGDLDGMEDRRLVRVLVPYSRTLYFLDVGGTQRGISYDYMRAFEDEINKKHKRGHLRIKFVFIPVARDRLLPELRAGRGDIAAANLTVTADRLKQVDFSEPLARDVKEIVVTGPGAPSIATLDALSGKEIFLRRASSYYEHLLALNKQFQQRKLAPIRLREAPGNFETEDLLEMVNAGLVKIVVADRYLALLWQQVYTDIDVHEDLVLHEGGDIAFAIRKDSPLLKSALDAFLKTHARGTTFGNITLKKYLQNTRWVKNATSDAEMKKFKAMLALFKKYSEQYKVDWLLMAAQGYQESQLDQSKRSHVGAIGVMQIMPATGKEMKVGDITKLEPNIQAGVKYIRFMIDEYYKDEPMDDLNRILFSVASYNAGPNRIRSLRNQAAKRGLNPNVWFDNVERLAAEKIGRETVQYVSNIFKYYVAYTLVVEQDLQRDKAA